MARKGMRVGKVSVKVHKFKCLLVGIRRQSYGSNRNDCRPVRVRLMCQRYSRFVKDESRAVGCRISIEECLASLLPSPSDSPQRLHEAMRYSALAPGKRIRPALCVASCVAVGGEPESALKAGCAVELVHCFSLIHDDLPSIDNDALRRGRETCHIKFGEAMAVLAGDALFALAFESMAGCSADPVKAQKCFTALAQASGSMGLVGGEVLDILAEATGGSLKELETIHLRKTASLIQAACEIGGVLGEATEAELTILREFGLKVGLAFQIADDILNETSTADELGKAVGSDRKKNKLTYPALVGLEESHQIAESLVAEVHQILPELSGDTTDLYELSSYALHRNR